MSFLRARLLRSPLQMASCSSQRYSPGQCINVGTGLIVPTLCESGRPVLEFLCGQSERNSSLRRNSSLAKKRQRVHFSENPKSDNEFPSTVAGDTECRGCGAEFQHVDPSKPGYLPPKLNPSLAPHLDQPPQHASVHTRLDSSLPVDEHTSERDRLLGIRPDSITPAELKRLLRSPQYANAPGNLVPTTPICQRCHRLTHHRAEYPRAFPHNLPRSFASLKTDTHHVVVAVLDILDIPASFPDLLPTLLGPSATRRIILAANKADALPLDFKPDRIRRHVREEWRAHLGNGGYGDLWDVVLVSAKTGQGIRDLVRSINHARRPGDDIVLVGAANAGKSQLINSLLGMAGGKVRVQVDETLKRDDIDIESSRSDPSDDDEWSPTLPRLQPPNPKRSSSSSSVTTSPLPGTTVSLIRFPLSSGPLARIFPAPKEPRSLTSSSPAQSMPRNRQPYLIDTPGLPSPMSLLNHLTLPECSATVPTKPIHPFMFHLTPGSTIFLGGVGRLDYVSGPPTVMVTAFRAKEVTLHKTKLEKADGVYARHVGGLLRPPRFHAEADNKEQSPGGEKSGVVDIGDSSSALSALPAMARPPSSRPIALPPLLCLPKPIAIPVPLNPQSTKNKSILDIVWSGAGWLAVTIPRSASLRVSQNARGAEKEAVFMAWSLGGEGCYTRRPLMPFEIGGGAHGK
ncbi:nitric oxide associated protein 1 [Gonapodya sp. JEL0774]|nr:nitric oxide associated protein 1 [Gonapodya sp. JEL0774]